MSEKVTCDCPVGSGRASVRAPPVVVPWDKPRCRGRTDRADTKTTAGPVAGLDAEWFRYPGEHGWFDKRWAYEESMRKPIIIRWPGKVKASSRWAAVVQNIDYAPTLLAVAGLEPDWKVHGLSLMPLLAGGGATPPEDATRFTTATLMADTVLPNTAPSARPSSSCSTSIALAMRRRSRVAGSSSILKKDPPEMTNLASDPHYGSMLEALKARFWKTSTFYDDTDESVWRRGRTKRFRPEDYIRQRR